MHLQADYLGDLFHQEKKKTILRNIYRDLKHIDFDVIAVRGISGLILAMTVADKLGKDVLIFRKQTERAHSMYRIEGWFPSRTQKWIILDDFIVTGGTIKAIFKLALSEGIKGEFAGYYGYIPGEGLGRWQTPYKVCSYLRSRGLLAPEELTQFPFLRSLYEGKEYQEYP